MKNFFISALSYGVGCIIFSIGALLIINSSSPIKSISMIYLFLCLISNVFYFFCGKNIIQFQSKSKIFWNCSIPTIILLILLFSIPGTSYFPLFIGHLFLKTFNSPIGYSIYFLPILSMHIGIRIQEFSLMKNQSSQSGSQSEDGSTQSGDGRNTGKINTGDGSMCP